VTASTLSNFVSSSCPCVKRPPLRASTARACLKTSTGLRHRTFLISRKHLSDSDSTHVVVFAGRVYAPQEFRCDHAPCARPCRRCLFSALCFTDSFVVCVSPLRDAQPQVLSLPVSDCSSRLRAARIPVESAASILSLPERPLLYVHRTAPQFLNCDFCFAVTQRISCVYLRSPSLIPARTHVRQELQYIRAHHLFPFPQNPRPARPD